MLDVVLVVAALVGIVIAVLFGGAIVSAIVGQLFTCHAESTHQDSPLVDLNK